MTAFFWGWNKIEYTFWDYPTFMYIVASWLYCFGKLFFAPIVITLVKWKCFFFYFYFRNTQYMTKSTIVSPVKMEYGWNFSISGLKMMVKCVLEKYFWSSSVRLPCHFYYWILIKSTSSVIKTTWRGHGGISKIFFLDHFSSSFLGQKC